MKQVSVVIAVLPTFKQISGQIFIIFFVKLKSQGKKICQFCENLTFYKLSFTTRLIFPSSERLSYFGNYKLTKLQISENCQISIDILPKIKVMISQNLS